jgi:hypothetical protein
MIRVGYTLALLFSLALLTGMSKLALSQHSIIPTSNTSSVVQLADDEGASTDVLGTDPDIIEQGPTGDGNVEG